MRIPCREVRLSSDADMGLSTAAPIFKTLLGIIALAHAQPPQFAELPGDVTVAGLFTVQSSTDNGQCGDIIVSSVQSIEAVKWVLQKLNGINYINGVNIGFLVGKTCRLPEGPIKFTAELIYRMMNEPSNSTPPIVGLIGPGHSGEAQVVSRMLSDLSEEERLLQIGVSTTAEVLSDHVTYPNFYRVVPPDSIQLLTIAELLVRLQWNRVVIIHQDDTYGKDAATLLKNLAEDRRICVPYITAIPSAPPYSIPYFEQIMHNISTENFYGIIFFGSGTAVRTLLQRFESYNLLNVPVFVFSDSLSLQDDMLRSGTGSVWKLSKGTWHLSPPFLEVTEFTDHWTNIFTNTSVLLQESVTNPWLLDVFEHFTSCQPRTGANCVAMTPQEVKDKSSPSVYTSYGIQAAYVMAKAFKQIHSNLCSGGGLCSEFSRSFRRGSMLGAVSALSLNFVVDFTFVPEALKSLGQISFDSNSGNVILSANTAEYQVFNFQHCADQASFCYKKVGDLVNRSLVLTTNDVRGYDGNGATMQWTDLLKHATCQLGHVCEDCMPHNLPNDIIYIPGDVLVVAIVPIYDTGDTPLSCGAIRTAISVDIAEGIRYALAELNGKVGRYRDMFVNKKVGLIVLNSCNNALLIQTKILSLHTDGLILADGSVVSVKDRIMGYIGGLGSSVSTAAARITGSLGLVQVAYGSTAALLSDRTEYPYFLRVVSPDDRQIQVIIAIVQQTKSDFIQLVHTTDTYGEGGKELLLREAAKNHICIIKAHGVSDTYNFNLLVGDLRKKGHAKVVVVMVRSHLVDKVAGTVLSGMTEGEFMLIGSESWGVNKNVIRDQPKARGFITVAMEMGLDGFKDYFRDLDIQSDGLVNPWLQTYVQKKFNCYLEWSFDKSSTEKCPPVDKLFDAVDYQHDLWTPFVISAALAFFHGANEAFNELCGRNEINLCEAFRKNPVVIHEKIKKVHLDISNKLIRLFDDNGDGTIGYTVYNVQQDPDEPLKSVYKSVGSWTLAVGLEVNGVKFPSGADSYTSRCPNEIECNNCFSTTAETADTSVPVLAVPVLAAFLGIFAVAVVILVVVVVCLLRRGKTENPYTEPGEPYERNFGTFDTANTNSTNVPQSASSNNSENLSKNSPQSSSNAGMQYNNKGHHDRPGESTWSNTTAGSHNSYDSVDSDTAQPRHGHDGYIHALPGNDSATWSNKAVPNQYSIASSLSSGNNEAQSDERPAHASPPPLSVNHDGYLTSTDIMAV